MSNTARGGREPSSARCSRPSSADSTTASPIAVPSPGLSESSADSTSVRSAVGGIAAFAREANETTPTRNFSGTFARNAFAATFAAPRRVGSTSSAFIERETSRARTTVASSRGTLTTACGLATPTIIAVRAARRIASGRYRSFPGARSITLGRSDGIAPLRGDAGSAALASVVEPDEQRDQDESGESERPLEAHFVPRLRKTASDRSHSPDVVRT